MQSGRTRKTDLIRDYLDGSLSAEQMAEAEQLLVNDPLARTVVDEHSQIETFIGRLKEAFAMPEFPAEKDPTSDGLRKAVAEQMQQSASANETEANLLSDPLLSTDSEKQAVPHHPLAFLSPPQAAGEMGRLNGYRVLKQLGEGGMGMVFEAEDMRLMRRVALKVMKPEIAVKEQHRARFIREAQTAAAIEHDHICPIYQVGGEENGVPFIAMPFLKGEALDARLKRQAPLPIAEAIRIGREVAEGLAAAHDAGLVHRDIKPGNIWLEEVRRPQRGNDVESRTSYRVKILDFGLARAQSDDVHLTASGAILGTPAYMAPEQARSKPVDHRADLFSLGVMLYEMTTGRRPFSGTDTMSILTSLAIDEPTAPNLINFSVPAELSDLIMRLLSKAPAKRPADGRIVAEELLAILMETSQPIVEAIPSSAAAPMATAVDATAVDPWQALDESLPEAKLKSPPVALPAASFSRSKVRPSSGSKTWIALALGLLLLGGSGVAAYKLFFETREGTLVVEVDGDADVRFKNGELQIFGVDGKLKYTLKPGERTRSMPAGPYKVEVVGADGVKLETTEFVMTKDGAKVRVTLAPTAIAKNKPAKLKTTGESDRKVAEWVLAHGGSVDAFVRGEVLQIRPGQPLPAGVIRLNSIGVNQKAKATDESIQILGEVSDLTVLALNETGVTEAGLEKLLSAPGLANLKNLHLNGLQIDNALWLKHVRGLEVLDLTRSNFRNDEVIKQFEMFGSLTTLRVLALAHTPVTDAGIARLVARSPQWVDLSLAATAVTDVTLERLKILNTLRALHIEGAKVTEAGVKNLSASLPECQILWDGGVIEPRPSPDRKAAEYVLSIGGAVQVNGQEGFIFNLTDLPKKPFQLTGFYQGNTKIGNDGLANFKGCKGLTFVNLDTSQVTDEGLVHLKDFNNVVYLHLGRSQVRDAGLANLKGYKSLKYLGLNHTQVSDAGLAVFKNCKDLDSLGLQNTTVTDSALTLIKDFKNLVKLDLTKTNVTAAGIEKLRTELPQCRIEWDGGVIEPLPSPDRKAAEYGLSLGGKIKVNEQDRDLVAIGDLPREPFRLSSVDLANKQVSDAGLSCFKGCKYLTHLDLSRTQVGDGGLAHFKDSKNLKFLVLGYSNVSDAGLAQFKDCTSLIGINLNHMQISDAGLANFKQSMKLKFLHLNYSPISGEGLSHFKDCKDLQALNLAGTKVDDSSLVILENYLDLIDLDLHGTVVGDAALIHLKGNKNLKSLELNCTQVGDAGMVALKDCTNLTDLGLDETRISNIGLQTVQNISKLRDLRVRKTKSTPEGIKRLAATLPQCRIEHDGGVIEPMPSPDRKAAEFVLSRGGTVKVNDQDRWLAAATDLPREPFRLTGLELGKKQVSAEGWATFKDCKNLTHLDLNQTQVDDAGLAYFKNCRNLTLLNLDLTRVSDVGLAAFKDCKNLTHLSLVQTQVGDAGLAYFKDRGNLTFLNLDLTRASDVGLASFKDCKNLTQLHLRKTLVTDAGLVHFKDCKNLMWLYLATTQVGDSGLANLKDCENLLHVELQGTNVTDAGLAYLKACKYLGNLQLGGTRVTDAGLASLYDFKSMRQLNVQKTKVTAAGIDALKKALPQCRIEWDDGGIEPKK